MATKNNRKTGRSILFGAALVLGICLFSAGCLSASPDTDDNIPDGADTKSDRAPLVNEAGWQLKYYDNGTNEMAPVIGGTEITLKFDENDGIAGSAGINNYFASYEEGDDALFGVIGSTKMAGPEDAMMQENTYLKLLNETASFSVEEDELKLCDLDGNVLLVFENAVAPVPVPLAGTTWKLDSYNDGNETATSVIAGTQIILILDENGGIAGSAGCNSYFGSYETEEGAISFGTVGSTMMFCDEPEGTMEQESAYLSLLESAAGYEIEGDSLTVQDLSGKPILTFTAVEQD